MRENLPRTRQWQEYRAPRAGRLPQGATSWRLSLCQQAGSTRAQPCRLDRIVTNLEKQGIGFVSLSENIDTSTPSGVLTLHIFSALSEYERSLIRERTNAGISAARDRGRIGGRPTKLTGKYLTMPKALMAGKNQ